MDPALASASAPVPVAFEDGLGTRRLAVDRSRNETVEMLCLRGELTAVPSFGFALGERLGNLAPLPPGRLRPRPQRRTAERCGLDAGAGLRRHRRAAAVRDAAVRRSGGRDAR